MHHKGNEWNRMMDRCTIYYQLSNVEQTLFYKQLDPKGLDYLLSYQFSFLMLNYLQHVNPFSFLWIILMILLLVYFCMVDLNDFLCNIKFILYFNHQHNIYLLRSIIQLFHIIYRNNLKHMLSYIYHDLTNVLFLWLIKHNLPFRVMG